MKSKHLSFIFVIVSLLTVGGGLWFETQTAMMGARASGLPAMAPLSDFKVPSKAQLEKMDRLERAMALLSTPLPGRQSKADLAALGYVPVKLDQPNDMFGPEAMSLLKRYQISLAFEGQFRRFCVIDGRLHAEGASLPDGAAILKIESKRVLISKQDNRQWVAVEPIFDSLLPEGS